MDTNPRIAAVVAAASSAGLTIDVRGKPRSARVVRRPIYKRPLEEGPLDERED